MVAHYVLNQGVEFPAQGLVRCVDVLEPELLRQLLVALPAAHYADMTRVPQFRELIQRPDQGLHGHGCLRFAPEDGHVYYDVGFHRISITE